VRPGAHMFWRLYGSTNATAPRETQPLVFWLQGGPGAGGSGYGDYGEMGPLDVTLTPRNTTWIQSGAGVVVGGGGGGGGGVLRAAPSITT
jgi:serine carboxypeptidase 1